MSKHQKALDKFCASPPPADLTWDEFLGVLKKLGFTKVLNGNGSRRKVYNPTTKHLIICHEPHPSPCVDKGCIVSTVEYLQEHNYL